MFCSTGELGCVLGCVDAPLEPMEALIVAQLLALNSVSKQFERQIGSCVNEQVLEHMSSVALSHFFSELNETCQWFRSTLQSRPRSQDLA